MCYISGPTTHMCEFVLLRAASHASRCRHKSHMCVASMAGSALQHMLWKCRAEYGWEQIGFAFASRALRASLPFPGWGLHIQQYSGSLCSASNFCTKQFNPRLWTMDMRRFDFAGQHCNTKLCSVGRVLVVSVPHVERRAWLGVG